MRPSRRTPDESVENPRITQAVYVLGGVLIGLGFACLADKHVFSGMSNLTLYYLLMFSVALVCLLVGEFARTAVHWWLLIIGGIASATIITVAAFGVGHYWDTASYIGKLLAVVIAGTCPVLGSAIPTMLARRAGRSGLVRRATGLLGGLLGTALSPWVALMAACAITKDCL